MCVWQQSSGDKIKYQFKASNEQPYVNTHLFMDPTAYE